MPTLLRPHRAVFGLGLVLSFQSPVWAQAASYAEPPALSLRVTPPVGPAGAAAAPLSPVAAVGAAMRARGIEPTTVASLVNSSDAPAAPGARHVRLVQQVDGLRVYGTSIKSSFNERGELVHLVERVAPVAGSVRVAAAIDEQQALAAAMARVHPGKAIVSAPGARSGTTLTFSGDAFFHEPPQVTRVLVPQADGRLAHGFLVQTWTRRDNLLDNTLVGGDGSVLAVEHRTANDSYNVFALDPERGPQALVEGPGSGNAESPSGWLGAGPQKTTDITGNNVHAYLDVASNNAPDSGGSAVGTGNFTTAANLKQAPSTAANRAVAVQNLFYLNNVAHDTLYRHGFDEAAGNFQSSNFSNSGLGNDPVLAEAQDGGGIDNANFATPRDGARPRMQMYLWSGASAGALQRDGDLDADIVYHEYGHGLTWRMIGGMDGPMSGAIGEGASDVVAFMMNGRDTVGAYAYSNPNGIRRYRYASYPLTYADVKGDEVHDDGEVYAGTMWRLRELWLASGRTNDQLFEVFVDGMNYTPSSPAFEQMRDGMLDSIAHSGASDAAARCTLVWKAFAQFGIGDGAKGTVSRSKVVVTPSTKARKTCTH